MTGPTLGIRLVGDQPEGADQRCSDLRRALGGRISPETPAGGGPENPTGGDEETTPEFWLEFTSQGLRLVDGTHSRGLFVDFLSGPRVGAGHRPAAGSLLARACGLDKGARSIVDATAGIGRDAAVLWAALRSQQSLRSTEPAPSLLLCEREPVLRALLEDAIARLPDGPRPTLATGDAHLVLSELHDDVDVVFLDPMFEMHRGTALPKLELQILRRFCQPDRTEETLQLLELARRRAKRRVVVKRGPKDPALGPKPQSVHRGRSLRFDVYAPV